MIGFPLLIADSERDMPGIEPWPLGWYTTALTNELKEVQQGKVEFKQVAFCTPFAFL